MNARCGQVTSYSSVMYTIKIQQIFSFAIGEVNALYRKIFYSG